jgi:hypothetical protein
MAIQSLIELRGETKWVMLSDIVAKVRQTWATENVNPTTIHARFILTALTAIILMISFQARGSVGRASPHL